MPPLLPSIQSTCTSSLEPRLTFEPGFKANVQAAIAICRSADPLSTIYCCYIYNYKDQGIRINVSLVPRPGRRRKKGLVPIAHTCAHYPVENLGCRKRLYTSYHGLRYEAMSYCRTLPGEKERVRTQFIVENTQLLMPNFAHITAPYCSKLFISGAI